MNGFDHAGMSSSGFIPATIVEKVNTHFGLGGI